MNGVLIISGTNRLGSVSLRVAKMLAAYYQRLEIPHELLDLSQLPAEIFAPDIYTNKPLAFQAIQKKVVDAGGLHVVTPEYNGSFPGILKYFIDLLKFPESFEHKPVAFVGLARGSFGALRPVEQLQMVFAYRNAHLFPDRVFIPTVHMQFDEAGNLKDSALEARLSKQAEHFYKYVKLLRGNAA